LSQASEGIELRRRSLDYLTAHHTVSLATQGPQGLWAATVFYASLDFALYFLSEPKTRHAQNVAANPAIAATVNEDYSDWQAIKGLQMEATCEEVRGVRETASGLAAYVKKYPFVAQFLSPGQLLKGMQIAGKSLDVRLYRVRPSRLFFLDNARGFSNREEVPLEVRG
jgi:hypothetical protein